MNAMIKSLLAGGALVGIAALIAVPFLHRAGPEAAKPVAPPAGAVTEADAGDTSIEGEADLGYAGDPERGRILALENCSGCHAVTPGTNSPVPEAPPFYTFGQRWKIEDLEEALAEGIMVGHEQYQMPVFQFEPDQIADLIAYLKSIQIPAPAEPTTQESPPQ